jgi:aminotransferase
MTEPMNEALSRRARELPDRDAPLPVDPVPEPTLEGLRLALEGGETHYTERPGMRKLRERIARRLALPGRGADTVVVTAGEEEALYVLSHAATGVEALSLGPRLSMLDRVPPDAVVTGSLDALPGLSSFRVGFVSAPPGMARSVRSWKQALSICTAAPSQRAALLSLGEDSGESVEEASAEEPATKGPSSGDEKRYGLMELAATLDGVLSLGRGDPDLATPPYVIEGALARMRNPPASLTTRGLPELREAIARRYVRDKGIDFDPGREILVTNGAQEGLFLAVLALLDPGERILVPDPRYGSYDQAVAAAGAARIPLPTGEGYDFGLSADAVSAEARGAKAVLLVNPSNPTGARTPPESVREISAVARREGLVAISDEVYEELAFDGKGVLSMAACEGMRERTVTLSSLSKTYAMTGFRVGYLLGPPPFIEAAARLKAGISGPTALFSQYAALSALEGPRDSIEAHRSTYASRLRVMTEGLDALGIRYGKPGGGLFLWADIGPFGLDAETFCRRLLTEARVLVFPGTSFGEVWRSYVRISLLQSEERLSEALARIGDFLKGLPRPPRRA